MMTEEQAEYKTETSPPGRRPSGPEAVDSARDQEFRGIIEVTEWLDGQGWKISKSALHRHMKAGRLRPDERGVFPQKAVEKYAIGWLKKRSDAEKVSSEKLAEQERKERIGYQSALRKKMEMQLSILDGKFIPRDQLYLELAARAAVLDMGIKALVQLRAEEWIQAGGGSHEKIAEFTRLMLADFDELVNSFSTTKQFQVMFKGVEEKIRQDLQDQQDQG
jgi:hypothetical protein